MTENNASAFALEMPALNYGVVTQAHADYCAEHGHATYTNGTDVSPRCPRCGETVTPATSSEKREAAIAAAKAEDAAAANRYRTMEPYLEASPEARETADAVFAALDSAGYVAHPLLRGVSLDHTTGSLTANFNLPNITGDPTPYLVGITHDGLLIRLAKYVHTGRMVRDEETGTEEPESAWRTVRGTEDRAAAVLVPALLGRPALPRWENAAAL
jgi:hypothetical protein